jgi:hypothetical protein
MIFVPTILDDLEQRLSALEAILPLQRSADEHDAAAAMLACMHEMRRLMDRLPEAQARYQEALTEDSRQEAHLALRRLIHDIRTPMGVLYTYLRLIANSIIFAHASDAHRDEANALVDMVRTIREDLKASN